ncbi:MAG: T9SS type A sorting domain-containing protein [Saprospiraceae bacterium]|nr:T9SS type A sorting domain-containing protein [Saprospiraceae bacterium]
MSRFPVFFLQCLGFMLLNSSLSFSQCVPPSADNCNEANVLCSLDEVNGYSCRNPSYSNPTGCSPLCPSGGTSYNASWWAFVCDGGPLTITITLSNCSVNGTGVQMGIWGDCACGESIVCNSDCNGPGTYTLTGNLKRCKTYYLFVDGCSGDVCDFTLTTSVGAAPKLPPIGNIMGLRDVCVGACNVKYSVPMGSCISGYTWTMDGVEIEQELNEITLDFPDEGDFTLCANSYIGNPQSGSLCDQSGPKCIVVKVRTRPQFFGTSRILCSDEIPFNWHGELISISGGYSHEFKDIKTCCVFDSIVHFNIVHMDSSVCQDRTFINGRVFLDRNLDGIFNAADIILKNYLLSSLPGKFASFSDATGYKLSVTKNAFNTILVTVRNPKFEFSVPSQFTMNVGNVIGQVPGQYDFAIQGNPWTDIEIVMSSSSARPGRTTAVNLQINNVGNVEIVNSKLSFNFPNGWKVIKSAPNYLNIIGGSQLLWEFKDTIAINSSKNVRIELEPPSTAKIKTPFTLKADVECLNDADSLNNQAIWNGEIVASYDPNDKLVDKTKYYPAEGQNMELVYTIRFQNTGTDTAFDVAIRDTLSKSLLAESVRIVQASHPYKLIMKKLGFLEIFFENILLPDSSTNEIASHGFVQIAVKPKIVSDPLYITNRASIYFDFNAPVITNTASTYVGLVNTTLPVKHGNLRVTPNPFNHQILVEFESPGNSRDYRLKIINLQGQQVLDTKAENSGQIQINSHGFSPGIYRIFYLADGKLLSSMNIMKMP